ncbi:energy transducer TonB [Terracidiphilus gabretensis]|jgi:periplasmic protein TonB|uniref:energy transducer TonB n=1 Tax=Terracidiphilus gabretensis TaxID=1577687 RepID=UPI00071B75DA|nr:energy transducer TonB [Terracidiphilus gabretensis]
MKENHVKEFVAESLVGLTVDTNGLPHDICVIKEAGHGLDRKAVEAVATYRFRPATRDDKPVSVQLKVAINFRLY